MRRTLFRLLRSLAEYTRRTSTWPPYFIRVGTSLSEAVQIVYAATTEEPPWSSDLIDRVCEMVLEPQGTDISLFALHTADRFDPGHALGVIAGTISTNDFDESARVDYTKKLDNAAAQRAEAGKSPKPKKLADVKDELGRKVATLIIPQSLFAELPIATPKGNLNFAPADELHHDAKPSDVRALASTLLDGIRDGKVIYTFIRSPDYRAQAAIALSTCIDRFGDLSTATPPSWRDGSALTAAEQLARLRILAGALGIQTRLDLQTMR